ncbi:MAG: hypothetical protein NC347_05760 [Clostridium sp.]|nr:hypothetical protein [Clostridium sp.]
MPDFQKSAIYTPKTANYTQKVDFSCLCDITTSKKRKKELTENGQKEYNHKPSQAKPSQAKPSQAKPSQA